MILGIDEAGRGPWAGPLVVGAVVLGRASIEGLNDSKQLTKKRREALESQILEHAAATGLGWVSAAEIDEIGLSAALRLATIRAVQEVDQAGVPYDEIIIDGTINFLSDTAKGRFVETMPKADALIPAVSAASIIAKVARDRFMAAQDAVYPGYGFSSHAGYGTAKHRAAIEERGVSPLHRVSFAPLKKYAPSGVTTKQIGDKGEELVVEYLLQKGHEIIARNWKTRFCEIDIISKYQDVTYFTEVKTRKNTQYGDGFEVITAKKVQQMKFSAEMYQASGQAILAVASVINADKTLSWRIISE